MTRSDAAAARAARLALSALLLVSLAGCDRLSRKGSAGADAGSAPAGSAAGARLSRPLKGEDVAVLLYGKGAPSAAPKWRPSKVWQGKEGPGLDPAADWLCEARQLLPFGQEGVVRALVVTSARPPDWECMACGTAVGVAVLTEVADGWRLDNSDLEVGTYGRAGQAPEAIAVQVGPGRVGVVLEPAFTAGGNTTKGLVLVAERRGGGFAEILDIPETEADNGGDCDDEGEDDATPCWEFATSWGFVRSEGKDLWDLRTTTVGTRVKTGETKASPFSETKLYRWDGAKYAPVR